VIVIDLPWPPKELSPNARVHRMEKARVARQYRQDCAWTTVEAAGGIHRCPRLTGSDLELIAEFRMPDKRWRDADNLLAMIKSGIDGVCDATGINDKAFRRVTVDRVMDGAGVVRLTIRESNATHEGPGGFSPGPLDAVVGPHDQKRE